MRARLLPYIVLACWGFAAPSPGWAVAASCPSALAVAQALYSVDHDFAFVEPKALRTDVSPRLAKALNNEFVHCGAMHEQCLDADIWTGANGWVSGTPPQFKVLSEGKATSSVSVVSTLAQPSAPALVATATVLMVRSATTGCWVVDDITLTDSTSLVNLLRSAR
jgi:hypothetical protein